MDAKTLEALKGSIKKWQKIVDGKGTDMGPSNCPLCVKFKNWDKGCSGCPVKDKTGRRSCNRSPFEKWYKHHNEKHLIYIGGIKIKSGCAECKQLAQAELDFLKSLLPEGKDA